MFHLLRHNFSWMIFNVALALIAVFLGWAFYAAKPGVLRYVLFFLWLIFVPNTIYIFTDVLHIFDDLGRVNLLGSILIILQYLVLFAAGFLTFVLSLYPVEKGLAKDKRFRKQITGIIIFLNFLIGFGIVLGRIHRLNSWDLFVDPGKVVDSAIDTLTSLEMILFAILLGLFANLLYFVFRNRIGKLIGKN